MLAKALTKEGEAVAVREQRRTEAADRATRRALKRLRLVEGKLERENLLKKNALKRAREADVVGAKDSACKKAKEESKALLNLFNAAKVETERLALEVEDKVAELKD